MVRTIVDKESGFHRVVDDEKGPLEEINAFLRSLEARGLSPLTVRAYAFDLVAFYRWLAGTDRSLKELTQADLLDFIAWEKQRCAQPRSINRRLTVCRLLHGFWFPGGLVARAGVSLSAPYYRGPGRDRYIGVHKLRKKPALALRVMAELRNHLKIVTKDIDIPGPIVTHRLRHTYATELLNAGMSLAAIMKLLGHKTIAMTARYADITLHSVIDQYCNAMLNISSKYETANTYGQARGIDNHPDRLLHDTISWLRLNRDDFSANPNKIDTLIKRIYRLEQEISNLEKLT